MQKYLPSAFTVLTIVLLAVNYVAPFGDLDWSWQVRTGEIIVQTGTLRISDSFSYTIHGTALHDFEWLYEVILYFVWSGTGIAGLKFLKVLVILTPLALLVWRLRVQGVKWHGILLCLGVALYALPSAWNLRPLFMTTIGLLTVAGLLQDHCTGRKPLPWWLPIVTLLWANMHPGVITGQGLLMGAIAWEWLNRRLHWNPPLDGPALKRLTLIGGLALLATFACPDPIERVRYTFKPELAHPIMRIFIEMHPLHTFLLDPPFYVVPVYLVAGLVLIAVVCRFRQFRVWELALLAGTALLGNFAFRSTMDWLLVMLAFGVPHLKELLAQAARTNRRRWWLAATLRVDRWLKKLLGSPLFGWQPRWIVVALAVLMAVSCLPLSPAAPRHEEWPVAALDAVEEMGLSGRFFASPDHGAYVGWRLRERGLAYTDTRGFFFPPLLLEDSTYIPQCGPDWQARIDRVIAYGTDFFLLETQGPRGQLWQTLRPFIDRPLYIDEQSVLLSTAQVKDAVAKRYIAPGLPGETLHRQTALRIDNIDQSLSTLSPGKPGAK